MNKDVLIVTLSDMHSGGTTALFPEQWVKFKQGGLHKPSSQQLDMYKHFIYCANLIAKKRKDKKLIVVHNGDAIDGNHHTTNQVVSVDIRDHVMIHIILMKEFKKIVDFKRGDELYYTTGTEVHTGDQEDECAKQLGAIQADDNLYVFDEIKKEINGRLVWWAHHGPIAGKGPNKGNSLRNFLKNIYYDCIETKERPPDFVVTGHTHVPFYNDYIQNYEDSYHIIHGIINPSFQQKTRYGHMRAPVEKNKIGLSMFEITASGDIRPPVIPVMK